jgi:uncharacterized membrane protein YfcA
MPHVFDADLFITIITLICAGVFTGIFAGTFGVGGAAIIIPVLYELFRLHGVPESVVMPLCAGTSLAIIAPTSIVSYRSHFKHGLVDTKILKLWIVPLIMGVVTGTIVSRYAPADVFKGVFILSSGLTGSYYIYFKRHLIFAHKVPGRFISIVTGYVIGFLSFMMGVAGGLMANIFLTAHGRPIHEALSTASGVGVLISVPGMIGYMIAGWSLSTVHPDVQMLQQPYAIGYVSLIGFAFIVPFSMLAAPVGVHIAHKLPRNKLEIFLGSFLLLFCLRFILSLGFFK